MRNMPRTLAVIAIVACVSALSSPADAQRRGFLKGHRTIQVLPTTAEPEPWRYHYNLFPAELRLALGELKFEVADTAPIVSQVIIHEHSGCRELGELLCVGGATEADVVFTDSASSETQTIRMRVRGFIGLDRTPPQTTSMEDWEFFASIQNRMGGTRYRNFKQRLVREIRRLM
jgi:hypothetical protein